MAFSLHVYLDVHVNTLNLGNVCILPPVLTSPCNIIQKGPAVFLFL